MKRVLFVHGIGNHAAGYSDPWRQQFNRFLNFSLDQYVEGLWEPAMEGGGGGAAFGVGAHPAPDSGESAVKSEIEAALQDRAEALAMETSAGRDLPPSPASPAVDIAPAQPPVGMAVQPGEVQTVSIIDLIRNAWESPGDFVRYLADGNIRRNVKALVYNRLLQATDIADSVHVIAHSWGTVVVYEIAHDLAREHPGRKIATLFTLGSPLWIPPVRKRLEVSTGEKPTSVELWVNIEARGDRVGNWLHPIFEVDRDFQLPAPGGGNPHGSYFVPGNDAVQGDVVARYIQR